MARRLLILLVLVPSFYTLDCQVGDVWVKNFIKFECYSNQRIRLGMRPIGCVPEDRLEGKVIAPGAEYRNEHFFFRCVREGDSLAYKIINCVDDNERVVEIGQFFTRVDGGRRVRVECEGNATEAKKTVVQWTSCTLPSGEKLSEGGIHLRYSKDSSSPQTAEIFSCKRDGPKVSLKCTGCVSSAGDQVVVSGYATVSGVQMQCRRFDDGCRLIKIDSKHMDCTLDGDSYPHDSVFNSSDGINLYYCKHGFLEKRGCFVNGEFVAVGDLTYTGKKPVFCGRERGLSTFGKYTGCTLKNGTVIRFKETVEEGPMMRRCLWTYTGKEINGTKLEAYGRSPPEEWEARIDEIASACVDKESGRRIFAEKYLQKGALHTVLKCSRNADGTLELRQPSTEEFLQYANSALSYNLLLSEIARGGYGNVEWIERLSLDSAGCADRIPFCDQLKPICEFSFSKNLRKLKESLKNSSSATNEALQELEDYGEEVEKRISLIANTNRVKS
ncbi:hypothetical protein QR680_017767 [Steinernema hermaphroditum]|uniref:Abnormal cell migration protein 18-like fibronectin type I domain-containing protein n=1 Tax=Steinernema hermaphroditum TaxID=289476 RepID=A0AA39HI42_9BILA|nr:hypothetical protein QR680_017767 [Steinernema hermaphroditum]